LRQTQHIPSCSLLIYFRIIVDGSISEESSPCKLCLLLAHQQFISIQQAITMATSIPPFTPLCASCHGPGNLHCPGCYLVTVSMILDLDMPRSLTNLEEVLQQCLSKDTLGNPQATLQVSARKTRLAAGMGATATPAYVCRRLAKELTVNPRHMALGQHAERRCSQT
jgi:hypothetical protein